MYEIAYYNLENITVEELKEQDEVWIYEDGFSVYTQKKSGGLLSVRINDEMIDEFLQETIDLLSKHFPIQNPVIVDTWAKEGVTEPPFHDNNLTFEVSKNVAIKDLIKFIFESIYGVDNQLSFTNYFKF